MFLINTISVVVPLVVAVLLAFPNKLDLGGWTKNLSHAIGIINSATTLFFSQPDDLDWNPKSAQIAVVSSSKGSRETPGFVFSKPADVSKGTISLICADVQNETSMALWNKWQAI